MGFQTTVIFLNDAVDQLKKDPNFQNKLYDAILKISMEQKPIDIRIGNHLNGCTVVEQHHADTTRFIVVGGNTAEVFGSGHWTLLRDDLDKAGDNLSVRILKILAREHGFSVKRKILGYQVYDTDKPADNKHHNVPNSYNKSFYKTLSAAREYARDWLGGTFESMLPKKPNVKVHYNGYGNTIEIKRVYEV
jgi:hypothetical protein